MAARNQADNNVPISSKFTWRIENFSQLKNTTYYSDIFTISSHKWKLLVLPKGNPKHGSNGYLSVYLVAVGAVDSLCVKFFLSLVDQIDSSNTFRKVFEHKFTAKVRDWGLDKFIHLKDLMKSGKGYVVNDVCIVEVEFTSNSAPDSTEELAPNVAGKETSKGEQSAQKMSHHPTEPSTQSSNSIRIGEYPNAGELFEEGKHHQQDVVIDDEKFEYVGGFNILKTQALVYRQIWLKYGHIATSKILRDSYSAQVTLVSGIMTSLIEMNQCMSVDKMSPEVIELFEFKIKMAEDFEFNVNWLREWFENVKKDFYMEQKIKTALVMQDQCLLAAMEQLIEAKAAFTKKLSGIETAMKHLAEAKDEFSKRLSGIETTISALLSETQMKKRKVSSGLLFDGLFQ